MEVANVEESCSNSATVGIKDTVGVKDDGSDSAAIKPESSDDDVRIKEETNDLRNGEDAAMDLSAGTVDQKSEAVEPKTDALDLKRDVLDQKSDAVDPKTKVVDQNAPKVNDSAPLDPNSWINKKKAAVAEEFYQRMNEFMDSIATEDGVSRLNLNVIYECPLPN